MVTRKSPAAPTPGAPRKSASRPTPAKKAVAQPKATPAPAAPKKNGSAEKKPKRQKPVRDSFTMPPADFALIGTLKERALAGKRETKKSELLRAGLHALAQLDGPALVAALGRLAPVKVGRPKKG